MSSEGNNGSQGHAEEGFVDVRTAADYLATRPSWIYDAVRLGKIPSNKFGALRRFRLSELAAWAEAQRQGPNTSAK